MPETSRLSAPRGTLAFVALALLATALPHLADVLEYDRAAMLRGEVWRPLTGQLVHWSWSMALTDVAVIAAAGAWVEDRSRKQAMLGIGGALLAVGVAITLSPVLLRYRGSSGVATALVTLALLDVARRRRGLGLLGLALLAAKIAVEMVTGRPVLSWTLPSGIALAPAAHVAGAAAGLAVGLLARDR